MSKGREKFVAVVKKAGVVNVAAAIGCSVSQVIIMAETRPNKRKVETPGLKIAYAIERLYKIKMEDWLRDS